MTTAEDSGELLTYLKAWRRWKGLKQAELAERAGVTPATISRLERGHPARLGTVGKLAEGLGIKRVQLLHVDPYQQRQGLGGSAPVGRSS